VVASVTPGATVNPVTRTARTAGTFGRIYPPWYRASRSTG
jgi:hypothetical protein